jgi:hypothetical protein
VPGTLRDIGKALPGFSPSLPKGIGGGGTGGDVCIEALGLPEESVAGGGGAGGAGGAIVELAAPVER